jgi:hypothetical protein
VGEGEAMAMKVEFTKENWPAVSANIDRWRAEMKELGMGRHGYFLPDGSIRWCSCKPCLKARAGATRTL